MILNRLRVENVRKIATADLTLVPAANVFVGPNGSGKTTLLESLFLLSGGRSFRTTRASDIIRHGQSSLTVVGELTSGTKTHTLGIEKTAKTTRLRLNNENVATASATVRLLPMLVINSESFKLLEGGPSNRRDLLDRVLFHVEPDYFDHLRRFYQILKQRNASIRNDVPTKEVTLWDKPLTETVDKIDIHRSGLVSTLNEAIARIGLTQDIGNVELRYEPGWKRGHEFAEALQGSLDRDRFLGTTTVGPHRAEVKVIMDGAPAKTKASRGQTKLIIVGLIAAMEEVIATAAGKAPLLLVDDLASELDSRAKLKAIQLLTRVKTQAFFTAIEYNMLSDLFSSPAKVFHVEQGQIVAD